MASPPAAALPVAALPRAPAALARHLAACFPCFRQTYRDRLLAWRYILPEIHISFFEPCTLEAALCRAGFRPEYQVRPRGYVDMVRFKTLKNIGVRKRGLLERAVPWKLVSYFADLRYQVTYHPYGVADPESELC